MKGPLLLVDGDIALYRALHGATKNIHWADEVITPRVDLVEARHRIDHDLAVAREFFGTPAMKVYLSCPTGEEFRHDLYEGYKASRVGKSKPGGYKELREYLTDAYKARSHPKLEADDLLGIAATGFYQGVKTVLLSADKDMGTIPCTWARDFDQEPVVVTLDQADYTHMLMTLTGDKTDDFPGIPGIGAKRGAKILDDMLEDEEAYGLHRSDLMWQAVVKAYEKAHLTEDDALTQARLARILRWSDVAYYDKGEDRFEIKLWTPPS